MSSFAGISAVGRLGKDAESKPTQSGKGVVRFSVAVETGWGEIKSTTWWGVTVFGRQTDYAAGLKKGDLVAVRGTPYLRVHPGKDGKECYYACIDADDVRTLLRAHPASPQPAPSGAEEVPF